MGGVKTDEKKQHFDDIYVKETPVPYKERIMDALEYVSDDFNKATFDRLVLPWAKRQTSDDGAAKTLNFVDLCGCFGNTTMACVYGMGYDAIRDNWRDTESCQTIASPRRFPVHTTAIDISAQAMAYGKSCGLYDQAIVADLNHPTSEQNEEIHGAMSNADILICTAALVYLDESTIQSLLDSFCDDAAAANKDGYVLVNFLNPFALEKADATKRLLLSKLEFVGSTATRHRKLSALERENYPGEDWALLELWVLKRRTSN